MHSLLKPMCFWSHSLSPLLLPVASQPLLSLSPQNCPESSLPGHVPHNVTPELLVMLTCALWAWSVLVPLSAPKLGARCCQQVPARSGAMAWLVTSCAVTSDGTGHQWGCSTGQLGWGYGSRWMEGGTAPGSSRISTGAITSRKVACAGVQSWQQGFFEVQGAGRDPTLLGFLSPGLVGPWPGASPSLGAGLRALHCSALT